MAGINSDPGGVTPAFFIGQDSKMGALGANVVSYNMNQYLASLYAANATLGVSTQQYAGDPTHPDTGWNGGIGALSQQATPGNQLSAAGSLGAQARATSSNSSSTSNGAPSLNTLDQTAPITAGNGGGSLPQAP